MLTKTFRQQTVREALRAVREDLGADALVFSTDMVKARGWRGLIGQREVQVTAGPADSRRSRRPPAAACRPADTDPPRDGLVARLLASGIDRAVADATVAQLSPLACRTASTRDLQAALASQVESLAAGEEAFARVEVFIGPPGVGKTTTIAKIAAQEKVRAGRPVALVGADGFRAGAVEQLRTYASIIGAPFRIARTLEDLEKAMAAGGRLPLLVDTAGRSPQDGGLRDLRRLLGSRRNVRTHLVMAGDTSAVSARRILDAYHDARPDRLVITKADEAESLSPLLAAARERGLSVSYIGTGQRVPDDLARATPAVLAGAMLCDAGGGWATAC